MKRAKRCHDLKVTEELLEADPNGVIELVNKMPGPIVVWDIMRLCYGLQADRTYKDGELVTTYGGKKSIKEISGDYVAKASEVYIDGRVDFLLSQKARWINEYDKDRTIVNVSLGRDVRATQEIKEGDWIFADYGDDYVRTY